MIDNNELSERLQVIAESLVGDEWEHPLLSVKTCEEAIKQLLVPQKCILSDKDIHRIIKRIIEILAAKRILDVKNLYQSYKDRM